jgi:anti-anti-sigma factor
MQSEIEKRDTMIVYRPVESVLNASHTVQLKSDFAVLTHTTESKPVVVDLSQVRSIDSSVLSALLMLRRLLEGQRRSLAIVSDQDAVKSVFRLSKMDMIMPLLPTLEEALAYFSQQELALMPKKVEDEPETEEDFEEGDEEEWDEEEWEDEEDWEDEDWEDEEWEDEEWEDEDWEDEEAEEDEED